MFDRQCMSIVIINVSTDFALASLTLALGRAMSSRSRWLLESRIQQWSVCRQEQHSLLNQTSEFELRH